MPTAEMTTKLVSWGNSQGIRLTKEMTAPYDMELGDELRIVFLADGIKVMPKKVDQRYKRVGHRTIEDVFAGYSGPAEGEEWLVGRIGQEVIGD